jgi:hypothetical protein
MFVLPRMKDVPKIPLRLDAIEVLESLEPM